MTQRVYDQWVECDGCGDVHVLGRCPKGYVPPTPQDRPQPLGPRFRVLDDVAINERPTPRQRWAGRLQAQGVALGIGATETWKTFAFLGLELSSLLDVPWLGADVIPINSSIYVAAEGAGGIKSRIQAWKLAHNIPVDQRLGLQIVDGAVNLFDADDTMRFIEEVVAPAAPCNVTIDTVARCAVGADENSARDMGLVLDRCYRVRDAGKGSVNIICHTNASETRERGSTALKYGSDNALLLQKTDDTVTLSSVKNKDMDPFTPVDLKLTKVQGSESCIVRLATAVIPVGGLSPSQQQALNALWSVFGPDGATSQEWQKTIPSMAERTFFAARRALIGDGYVTETGKKLVPRRRA